MIQFDEHIVQLGWNHQLDLLGFALKKKWQLKRDGLIEKKN